MALRLKSKDLNAVFEFATTDADNRCTTSLFKTNTHYLHIYTNCYQNLFNIYLMSNEQ